MICMKVKWDQETKRKLKIWEKISKTMQENLRKIFRYFKVKFPLWERKLLRRKMKDKQINKHLRK